MKSILTISFIIFSCHLLFSQDRPIAEIEGKLTIEDIPGKIIMKSPDGNCWQISVANDGQISSTPVLCESYSVMNVTITNSETYIYEFDIGDEEGVAIHADPEYAMINKIITTNVPYFHWEYQYRPTAGYLGTDQVTLAFATGSDGASPSTHIEYLTIYFTISE